MGNKEFHDLKVVRYGTSNVVIIPRAMSEQIGVAPGDFVRLNIQKMKLVPAEETTSLSKRKKALSGNGTRDPRLFSGKVIKSAAPASEPARVLA